MSCQSLADTVASYYLKSLDNYRSHADNIRSHLLGLLLTTTQAVLHGDERWMMKPIDEQFITRSEISHRAISIIPNDELYDKASSSASSRDANIHVDLSPRSIARMQACLEGCILALPQEVDESIYDSSNRRRKSSPSSISSSKNITTSSYHSKQVDSKDLSHDSYLTSALSGFSLDASTTVSTSSLTKGTKRRLPQISSTALATRLELYFRTLRRVYEFQKTIARGEGAPISDGECFLALESNQVLESHITVLVQSFVATAGCVSSMRTILTDLLSSLTMQLLAVSTLSESMNTSIRDLVLAYEHLTCFASLAFLSTPKDSAETKLGPLIRNYLNYLRSEWKNCVLSCQVELFLSRSLDPHLRHIFKTIEFQSTSHLLEVCRYHKELLENIPLANVGHSISATINTDVSSVKQALRDLRREVIIVNGRIIPPVASLRELVKTLKSILNARTFKLKESKIGIGSQIKANNENPVLESPSKSIDLSTTDDSSETEFVSSGDDQEESTLGLAQDVIKRKKSNTIEAIDVVTRRLIVAASRSEKGGDAYFVVNDLFGDETVDIVQLSQLTDPFLSWMRTGNIHPRGSIEFLVRLSSIVIKLHANFHVYPKNSRGDPLIQLSTTTTETIFLQEIRVDNSSRKVMLTENPKINATARKLLAIRPAKYERVENGFLPT